MEIKQFQELMRTVFFQRDAERGVMKTFAWFVEEVGELAHELRQVEARKASDKQQLGREFGDVFAWLCSMANLLDIDLEKVALAKYPFTCGKCRKTPCECENA
ncbi:MAG: nucleotide pyrophosphohydrolase [Candidatus Lokiarchaeota archaeon]|nr:nucleotide pyrophosphohydrolase [Candidatus Lokiarchaeota archaeon]